MAAEWYRMLTAFDNILGYRSVEYQGCILMVFVIFMVQCLYNKFHFIEFN